MSNWGAFPRANYCMVASSVVANGVQWNCRRNGCSLAHISRKRRSVLPPFSFYTHVICSEAKARNDSSLKLSQSSHSAIQNKHGASRVPVGA